MITKVIHSALCISTEEYAGYIMEDLFILKKVKSFTADSKLINNLFGIGQDVEIIVYNTGSCDVEVFIAKPPDAFSFAHLCFSVDNRKELIERAENIGLQVTYHERDDNSHIVFIKDLDGNLYEIKEG